MKRYLSLVLLSLFFLGGIFFYQSAKINDGKLHLIVCDVGQGDAIYLKTPSGKDILVDGGPNDSVLNCLNNNMPFWDRTLDLVVLTHPDADHISGLVSVLERYTVLHFVTSETSKSTGIYKKFLQQLQKNNLALKYVYSKDKIDFTDGVVSEVIWPTVEVINSSKPINESKVNEFSVIQVITFGNFKALLTGDAGAIVEDQIAKDAGDIDILKVPHHGSKTAMTDYFLSATKPELAVISVGAKNSYGHPTQITLGLLENHNAKILRTDKNGEVEITTDGKNYWVYPAPQ